MLSALGTWRDQTDEARCTPVCNCENQTLTDLTIMLYDIVTAQYRDLKWIIILGLGTLPLYQEIRNGSCQMDQEKC